MSTVTRGVDHAGRVVAPAEAGLDDRDLDLALGHLPQRGGRQQFELRHVVVLGERAVDALGGPRRARDRRARTRRRRARARRSARARGRRPGAARCRRRCAARGAARIAAVIRVVEDLPLVPSTWIVSKRRSGEPSTVIMRRIRSSPKRIPNSSSERSCARPAASRPAAARWRAARRAVARASSARAGAR